MIKAISERPFLRNVFTLMTGTVLSQVINIICMPFLARIYSPADYGIAGAILSIATILAALVTFSLQNAIILARDDDTSQRIASVNIYISILTCSFFFLLFLLTRHFIAYQVFNLPQIENWILLVPVYTLLASFYVITQFYANRKQYYRAISSSRMLSVFFNLATAFSVSFIIRNEIGLITGLLAGQLVGFSVLTWRIWRDGGHLFRLPHRQEFVRTFKAFRNFPLFSMPADLINVFTSQLPTVMLGHYTTVSTIGQYNMSNRILGLPAVFLSGAITDVFKQRASKDFHETGTYRPIFLKTFKTLSLLALPPFLIVGIFGADIFQILLGSQWRPAGTISQLLALMFFFKFIVSPLSYIIYIAGKNWFSFIMDSIGFIASYLVFRFFLPDVYMAFMFYAGVYVVLSAITFLFCYYTK